MICVDCVFKPSIVQFVHENGSQNVCGYCGADAICVEDDKLASWLESRARAVLVPSDKLSVWDQINVFEARSGEPPVFELWDFFERIGPIANENFMDTFAKNLPEERDGKGNKVLYSLNDGDLDDYNDFEWKWDHVVRSIKHDLRFLNRKAEEFCDSLFKATATNGRIANQLIREIGHDVSIYRARIANSENDIKHISESPISQLGPVPPTLASSQRMTPAGVSSFYAALDRETCISELRPLVGDVVITGEFRGNKNIHLLDLDALAAIARPDDVFSDDYLELAHASAFYEELVFQLSRPSSRSDQNSYLASQYIFEYLGSKFGEQIQGLVYSSVQRNGAQPCIALFPNQSNVSNVRPRLRNGTPDVDEKVLKFIDGSLRYHRIKSAVYEGSEYESADTLLIDDRIMRLMFPSDRY